MSRGIVQNATVGGHTRATGTTDHQAKLDTLLDILLATELYLMYETEFNQ